MSKICDCAGSDRAYVLINKASEDREEILSLSPPICHEPKVKGLRINGEITQFNKPLIAGNEYTINETPGEGFTVTWDDGHIDTLPGNWSSTNNVKLGQRIRIWITARVLDRWNRWNTGTWSAFKFNGTPGISPTDWMLSPVIRVFEYRNPGNDALRYVACETYHDPEATNSDPPRLERAVTRINNVSWNYYKRVIIQSWYTEPYGSPRGEDGYEVRNDLGDLVFRVTNNLPTIAPNPATCVLIANLDNGEIVELGEIECDANIEIIQALEITDEGGVLKEVFPFENQTVDIQCERQCPPKTCCNPCQGALNCCYEETGKLIDSFTRRT